nr:GTP-binding protein [Candidatus Viridilinea mediisalina]
MSLQQVLRAKGTFWLATRVHRAGQLQKTGRYLAMGGGALWLAAVPRNEWPQAAEVDAYVARYWDATVGDCRQELVCIGIKMNESAIRTALDAALLTDEELALDPEGWQQFDDPLPAWV